LKNDTKKKWNTIILKPLNPNVGIEADTVKRQLFPTDNKLVELIRSEMFQGLLETDASTKEGQLHVAEYYGVTNEWKKIIEKQPQCTVMDTYYLLLKTVKCISKKDNVWISFYEGLHRHAALMLSLLSSTFNMRENILTHKTLTRAYFREQHLANYVEDDEQPHERLFAIFNREMTAQMLTKKFRVRGLIPKKKDSPESGHEVEAFTEKIVKYSQLISESKKTSADNSTSTLLVKAFYKSLSRSTAQQRNYKPSILTNNHPGVGMQQISLDFCDKMFYKKLNWNVEPTYTIQKDITPANHQKKMNANDNDEHKAYGWCGLLCMTEWLKYIDNPLNDSARNDFSTKMTCSSDQHRYPPPPYGIHFESMAIHIGKITKGVRHVDPRHLNGFDLIPIIVTILHAKKKNETLSNVVTDEMNKNMINYICRYIYGMKGFNNNTMHPAVEFYLPEVKAGGFLNNCVEKYQILPVTVFLITMYNACFMFQEKKDGNDLITAMERVNLTRGLDDNTFFTTMSK